MQQKATVFYKKTAVNLFKKLTLDPKHVKKLTAERLAQLFKNDGS